jgi:hypothetical protein
MLTNPHIAKLFVEAHIDDLRRAAGTVPPARPSQDGAFRRLAGTLTALAVRRRRRPERALAQASEPCS